MSAAVGSFLCGMAAGVALVALIVVLLLLWLLPRASEDDGAWAE